MGRDCEDDHSSAKAKGAPQASKTATMKLSVRPGLEVSMCGPPPEAGPLPGLFYFAFSDEESLTLDPYNQPVAALAEAPIRCYSITLPFHGDGFRKETAMERWAEDLQQGAPQLRALFDEVEEAIRFLVTAGWLLPNKIATAGLSRGGWVATQVAARHPSICAVVGFAPLTRLSQLTPEGEPFDLHHLCDRLTNTAVRFYMGNRDERVSTRSCFEFIEQLAEAGYSAGHRSPKSELILTPSIGHMGHGTPKSSFIEGAKWIQSQL